MSRSYTLNNSLGAHSNAPHQWVARASHPIRQREYSNPQTFDPQLRTYINFCFDGGPGLPLSSILNQQMTPLASWSEPWIYAPKDDVGQKITLRVNWPGYGDKCKQINVRIENHRGDAIPVHRLLKKLAEAVRDIMENLSYLSSTEPRYKVSDGTSNGIRFEDVRLAGLERVGKGSWQPHLNYVISR